MKLEFHDNPNYIITCEVQIAPGSRDKFATITEEKDLKYNSVNFIIAMSRWSCIISYTASDNKILLSLYGNYLAINLDCDGIWQAI